MSLNRQSNAVIAAIVFGISSTAAFGAPQDGNNKQSSDQQQPQGLYSAEQLLNADVYTTGSDKEVGEVEDIIFNNDMTIKSFAVQTESSFGLGGKSYVVAPGQITVQAAQGDEATEPEYRVMLNANAEQLRQNPVYSESWWNETQQQASAAWEATKATASSAWVNIKQGAANLVDQTEDAADETAAETDDAADEAAEETGDAADTTADAADNAADNTADAAGEAANEAADTAGNQAQDAADNAEDEAEDAAN